MKTKSKIRSFFCTFLIIFAFNLGGKAQLTIDTTMAPTNMITNLLASPGVISSSAFYTGHPKAIGHFFNGNTTNLGMNSGVIMTTGVVNGTPAIGSPATGFASTVNGIPENPILTSLYDMFTNEDAAILDFQITPLYDTLKFRYVFASEEHPLFDHDPGADKFGFFISGPDPTGGVYNKKNIALIPNTNIPVLINSVHSDTNSQYYIDNNSGMTIVFNGFTTVMTAWCLTTPCMIYDVRIVVSDLGPGQYDSAIFLEEGSLTSTSSVLLVNIINQPQDQLANVGQSVSFTVDATAGTLITYQWQVSTNSGNSWSDIDSSGNSPTYSGWQSNTLNLSGLTINNNGYKYRCIIKDETCGPADTSNYSTLYVVSQSTSLTVQTGLSPLQMVQNYFVGNGICIDSASYKGNPKSIGAFLNGGSTNLGLNSGLILSSGYVDGSGGYQIGSRVSNFLSDMTDSGTDTTLQALVSNSVNDASALTFDFITHADTISFRFVFASEEYPEFVGSSFNDVFGFFISGPDPSGGYYSEKNIAFIPGTTIPITINNLNGSSYSQYYIDNQSMNGQSIIFDGFTTVITAKCAVIPCSHYNIKIAIGDVSDQAYDSGVFLEAGSFQSVHSPFILNSPTDQFVYAGDTTAFNVTVNSSLSASYQWQFSEDSGLSWTDINSSGSSPEYNGWHTNHLSLSNIPDSANGFLYRCSIIDSSCNCITAETSEFANLFVYHPNWPIVVTSQISNINTNSAVTGGTVVIDGGFFVTQKGVCWAQSNMPDTNNSHSIDGNGIGQFASNINGLSSGTTYYVRAYATNSTGTSYGNVVAFTTETSSIEDIYNKDNLIIYPNPANDFITVKTSDIKSGSILTIYDVTGRIVLEKGLIQNESQIDIGKLVSGIYYVKIVNENTISGSKFIKQ